MWDNEGVSVGIVHIYVLDTCALAPASRCRHCPYICARHLCHSSCIYVGVDIVHIYVLDTCAIAPAYM